MVCKERDSLVPLDDSALNLKVGQSDTRLPRLRRVEDEIVERVADLCDSGAQGDEQCAMRDARLQKREFNSCAHWCSGQCTRLRAHNNGAMRAIAKNRCTWEWFDWEWFEFKPGKWWVTAWCSL